MRVIALLLTFIVTSSATAAGPTCALLDPEKTPRAALLEAKLLAEPNATWVERASIDKILAEQKLQAAFSPQGVGERVKLGKLLKADLLVMVRPVKDVKEQAVEVVVSETATGLRLLLRAVPVTKNADEDVAALLTAARDGIKRHGEAVKEIVAVPPFVSQNLEFTHDHLKGAFAKLAEAEALDRRGVLVVELEEAESLAKEIALAAPGTTLSRPLPVYLLGEFRHDGKGKEITVSVKLRAERGGKPVGKPEVVVVKPDESPAAVRKWSAGILDALAKDDQPRPLADPKAEAKTLAERSVLFRRLGNWHEALALAEASLLLDPNQVNLHADAIRALTPITHDMFMFAFTKDKPGAVAETRRLYTRGLGHIEAFITKGGDLKRYRDEGQQDIVTAFRQGVRFLYKAKNWTPADKAQWDEMDAEERNLCLRVIPLLAKLPDNPELIYVQRAINELTKKDEKYATLEKIIASLKDVPNSRLAFIVLRSGLAWDNPEYRALLARLTASNEKRDQAVAVQLKTALDDLVKNPPKAPKFMTDPAGPPAPDGPAFVKFLPIDLGGLTGRSLNGVLAISPTLDVFWSTHALFLMKAKGKLEQVWAEPGERPILSGFSSVVFDGQFVWATYNRRQKPPLLLVLDPATGKVFDLSATEGLPRPPEKELAEKDRTAQLLVTVLEPGRACVCGSFFGRAWIGVVTFDAKTSKATVKILHEAREAPDRTDKEQWKRTDIAFNPYLLVALAGKGADGKPDRRVLVGRGCENFEVRYHPLVIDPDRATVEVFPDRIQNPPGNDRVSNTGDAIYFIEHSPHADRHMHLMRIAYPGKRKEVFVERVAPSVLDFTFTMARDGRLHAIIFQMETDFSLPPEKQRREWSQWWTVRVDDKNPEAKAHATLIQPAVRCVGYSAHYGVIAWVIDKPREKPASLQQVLIEELTPAPKQK